MGREDSSSGKASGCIHMQLGNQKIEERGKIRSKKRKATHPKGVLVLQGFRRAARFCCSREYIPARSLYQFASSPHKKEEEGNEGEGKLETRGDVAASQQHEEPGIPLLLTKSYCNGPPLKQTANS